MENIVMIVYYWCFHWGSDENFPRYFQRTIDLLENILQDFPATLLQHHHHNACMCNTLCYYFNTRETFPTLRCQTRNLAAISNTDSPPHTLLSSSRKDCTKLRIQLQWLHPTVNTIRESYKLLQYICIIL